MENILKILQHIEKQGLSVSEFERKAGLSNGYLTNTQKRGADVTNKILEKIRKNLKEDYSKIFGISEKSEIEDKKNPGPNQEFFQKYVEQLERNNAMLEKNLAQMEQRLRAVDKAFEQIEIMKGYMNRFEKGLEAVNTNLDEIAENQFLFGAVQQGWQEYWSEHLKGAPSKPLREVKEMIRIKVISLLHSYEEKGKSAVLQQDN